MKILTVLSSIILLAVACNENTKQDDAYELIRVEKMFSDMSASKGMTTAFNYYCASDGVLLRTNSMPVVGKSEVVAALSSVSDDQFTLTWKPIEAVLANSGDLGYTFGTYKIDYTDDQYPDGKGTYVTIWSKNSEGEWRFLLDTGNEGLGDQEDSL